MAYDTTRQRVVLFGGGGGTGLELSDTWEWDGSTWTQRSPPSGPPARDNHAMAYDTARQRLVLFGGNSAAMGRMADTWEWDGSTWTWRIPNPSPAARMFHAMAYDAIRQRIVLFGGADYELRPFGDTVEWDGTAWVTVTPPLGPSPRYWHGLVYHDALQRVVLLGGGLLRFERYTEMNDTWLYGNLVPASVQAFGVPCVGTNGLPRIATAGLQVPFLGNPSFPVGVSSARASSPCLIGLADRTQSMSLGGGCTLYLQDLVAALLTATNVSGSASVDLSIPLDISLRGGVAYAQGFVYDPMGSFAGLAITDGLKLVFGD